MQCIDSEHPVANILYGRDVQSIGTDRGPGRGGGGGGQLSLLVRNSGRSAHTHTSWVCPMSFRLSCWVFSMPEGCTQPANAKVGVVSRESQLRQPKDPPAPLPRLAREVGSWTLGAMNYANGRESTQRTEMAMKAVGQARLERKWRVHTGPIAAPLPRWLFGPMIVPFGGDLRATSPNMGTLRRQGLM